MGTVASTKVQPGSTLPEKRALPTDHTILVAEVASDPAMTLDEESLASMPVQALALLQLEAPPPQLPQKKKSDIYMPSRYADLDHRVSQVHLDDVSTTLQGLSSRLIALADSLDDVSQLRALFYWASSVVVADVVSAAGASAEQQPDNTAISYLLKIHRCKGNYAHLMAAFCNCAGIPVRILTGVTKSAAYRLGKPIDRVNSAAQWNAVHVAGEWRLLDCLWASTCAVADDGDGGGEWQLLDINGEQVRRDARKAAAAELPRSITANSSAIDENTGNSARTQRAFVHRINDFFFLPEPAELGATHYPNEAAWQLVAQPLSWTNFERGAYVRERFFQLGARFGRPELAYCEPPLRSHADSAAVVELFVDAADSPSVSFKYVLSQSRAELDGNADGQRATQHDLRKCVFFERKDGLIRYTAHLPTRGTYKLDVYGRDERTHAGHDLMCSHLLANNSVRERFMPLPDEPTIGWGPGASCDAFGLAPVSHRDARIDTDPSTEVDVVFSLQYPLELRHALISGSGGSRQQVTHLNYSVLTVHEGIATVSLRVAKAGIYALKLYAGEEGIPVELQNVCNYLVTCRSPKQNNNTARSLVFPALPDANLGATSYCRELGVEPVARCHPLLLMADRHVDLQFACDGTVELYAAISTATSSTATDRCVRSLTCDGCYNFRIDLRDDYEMLVRMYACRGGDQQRFYNVYNCLIRAPKSSSSASYLGPVATGVVAEDVVVHNLTATIPLPRACSNPAVVLSKKNAYMSPSPQQATLTPSPSGGGLLLLKLPDRGEYEATIYEKCGNGALLPFKKYNVFREGEPGGYDDSEDPNHTPDDENDNPSLDLIEDNEAEMNANDDSAGAMPADANKNLDPDKRRAARLALRRAVDAGTVLGVQNAIAEYLLCGGTNSDDLVKAARRHIKLRSAEDALRKAMEGAMLKPLQDALAQAREVRAPGKLGALIKTAERKLAQLQFADQLSKAVFSLDQRAMSEMRAYAHPPEPVFLIAKATLLLLGNHYSDVQDWRQVQVWLGKTGAESLKRRVMAFNYQSTPVDTIGLPKEIYGRFSLAEVRAISAGAATFYVWGSGMIGLIEQLTNEERQEKLTTSNV